MSGMAETLLTFGALVAFLALGVWSPWKNSDHPLWWLVLTGICALAFVTFGVRLTR